MRLLFIDPPFYRFMGYYTRYFPYGLACLAASARELGHEAGVLNADHDPHARGVDYQALSRAHPRYLRQVANEDGAIWRELLAQVRRFQPDWVGITALTAKMAAVLHTATLVRRELPEAPIVVGGPHAVARPRELLENSTETDAVFIGEGESSLGDLVAHNRSELLMLGGQIPGLVTREHDALTEAPPEDIEALPDPSRDSFLGPSYSREDLGLVMTSRGCPYSCTYCFSKGLWRRKVRLKSVDALSGELSRLKSRFRVGHVTFKDDVFTLNTERTKALCHELRALRLTWDCVTRVDTLSRDLLSVMKQSGCIGIKIGVETGSERIMKQIDRRLDKATIRRAATWLRESGIFWTAYFMMGLPGERLEDVETTYEFMTELSPDFASLSGYEAFPGTALFQSALTHGIVTETMNRQEFFHTSPHDYYFSRRDRGMILPEGTEYQELEAQMQRRFHKYNSSPIRLAKRFKPRLFVWRNEPRAAIYDMLRLGGWLRQAKGDQ